MDGKWVIAAVVLIVAAVTGYTAIDAGQKGSESNPVEAKPMAVVTAASPAAPHEPPCPVKLVHPRMYAAGEENVDLTIQNVSDQDITAIAFGATHTDRFGEAWEPYKTVLTLEETIKKGQSRHAHWEVLMEEHSKFAGAKNSSNLYLDKIAFKDGRTVQGYEFHGCSFDF